MSTLPAPRGEVVDAPDDPRVADFVGLTDGARRMKHEPGSGFFIAEGEKVIARTAAAGYPPRSLLLSPQRLADLTPAVAALDCPVYVASYDVLQAVTGFHVHRGALASFGRLPLRSAQDVLATASRVVVMEAVTNHTNLGAVFRSAAALGMDAVLLSPTSCDPLYRRTVRVSMGQVFAVPYAYLERWPEGIDEVVNPAWGWTLDTVLVATVLITVATGADYVVRAVALRRDGRSRQRSKAS